MAILRQENWLSQQRVDLPHLRSIESAVAGDFDSLVGRAMGGSKALVVRGFVMTNITNTAPAIGLQVSTANGILFNVNATESGSFLWIPADRAVETLNPATNQRITGSWTPSAVNYVGLDFVRASDVTTTDLVQFLDANTLIETPKQVPLARTLDYRIVISTLPFTAQPNLIPVARVTLNSSSQITAAIDARPMMFRLGSGGDNPNVQNSFPWADGRTENFSTLNNTLFVGGDKSIQSLKGWQDAAMSRMWELGGGEYWYSATADRNVQMVTYGATFTNGEYFSWNLGTQTLSWQNIRFLFDNSTGWFNDTNSGSIVMNNGDALYVDLDRTQNATGLIVQKAPLISLSSGNPPGSRWIMAWRKDNDIFTRGWRYPVGTTFQPATTTSLGEVELNKTPANSLTPAVVSIGVFGVVVVDTITANGAGAGRIAGSFTGGDTSANTTTGGAGLVGIGGANSGTTGIAGAGVNGLGGNATSTSQGGYGAIGQGGTANGTGVQGIGGNFTGAAGAGSGSALIGGLGSQSQGGAGSGTGGGGVGATIVGGVGGGTAGTGGNGATILGGTGGTGANGGRGATITGGNGAGAGNGGIGLVVSGGSGTVGGKAISALTSASGVAAMSLSNIDAAGIGLDMTGHATSNAVIQATNSGAGATVYSSNTQANHQGIAYWINDGTLRFSGGIIPTKTTAFNNQITSKNITTAHCVFTLNGTGSPTYVDGFNVTSVGAVTNVITITFAQAMANATYNVQITSDASAAIAPPQFLYVQTPGTTTLTLQLYTLAASVMSTADATTTTAHTTFHVMVTGANS